jgi:hypothetical protein
MPKVWQKQNSWQWGNLPFLNKLAAKQGLQKPLQQQQKLTDIDLYKQR